MNPTSQLCIIAYLDLLITGFSIFSLFITTIIVCTEEDLHILSSLHAYLFISLLFYQDSRFNIISSKDGIGVQVLKANFMMFLCLVAGLVPWNKLPYAARVFLLPLCAISFHSTFIRAPHKPRQDSWHHLSDSKKYDLLTNAFNIDIVTYCLLCCLLVSSFRVTKLYVLILLLSTSNLILSRVRLTIQAFNGPLSDWNNVEQMSSPRWTWDEIITETFMDNYQLDSDSFSAFNIVGQMSSRRLTRADESTTEGLRDYNQFDSSSFSDFNIVEQLSSIIEGDESPTDLQLYRKFVREGFVVIGSTFIKQTNNSLERLLGNDEVIGITFESNLGTCEMLVLPNRPLSMEATCFVFENVKATKGLLVILQKLGINGMNCLALELAIPNRGPIKFSSVVQTSWLGLLKPKELPAFIEEHCQETNGQIKAGYLKQFENWRSKLRSVMPRGPSNSINITDSQVVDEVKQALENNQIGRTDEVRMSDGSFYVIEENQYIQLIVPAKTMILLSDAEVKLALNGGFNLGFQAGISTEGKIALSRCSDFKIEDELRTAHKMPVMSLAHLNELERSTDENRKPELDERYSRLSAALFKKGYKVSARNTSLYQLFSKKYDCDLREFKTWFGEHGVKANNLNFRLYYTHKITDLSDVDFHKLRKLTEVTANYEYETNSDVILTVMKSSCTFRLVVLVRTTDKLHCTKVIFSQGIALESKTCHLKEKIG